MRSALYTGRVVHARLRPKRHLLRYRVFSLLLDLDELPLLGRTLRLFGHNRPSLFSFDERDHGDGRGALRPWVLEQLERAGIALSDPRISLLCYPRILGYVFNPLTVYFCAENDALKAIIYEVHNTFGERQSYLLAVENHAGIVTQSCDKELYVSPFVPMACRYDFRVVPPGERVAIGINEVDNDGLLLTAQFAGTRRPLCDRELLRAFLAYPLMTLKVTAAIHWEAARLWAKGVPVFRH